LTRSAKKSLVAILLILVLPVVAYGVFQLNSLTVDERELTTIYRRQLESVLFSVNQTAQDKSEEFFGTLQKGEWKQQPDQVLDRLGNYRFFFALYSKELTGEEEILLAPQPDWLTPEFRSRADSLVWAHRPIVDRLVRYLNEGNFQKVQSFESFLVHNKKEVDFQFFASKAGDKVFINIYFFSAVGFIEQALVPKFQEMAQGDFIITCNRISDGTQIYSTSGELVGDIESEPLDLLPRFEVGIAREGGTVEQAVNRRKNQNLIALGLLMMVMIIGVWLVFRNVQKEMELAQKKADFVSNVSHEIRTPLALINMFAETLLLDRVKEEAKKKEYYEIITKEVSRLTNMLNRILSFSKIEANKREYKKSRLDVSAVVEDVMSTYSYHLESNGFEHTMQLHPKPLEVMADREAITEVLVNLIDNGMKYSPERKQLEVRTTKTDDFACIMVKDNGLGIAKNQLDKLFEKFYRVPTGDVHDTKGAGLGLSIVKHIIDDHEGRIKIDSQPGEGSTFSILLPLAKKH
jgi:two-component system phosphate regulon sensor histidine kinase PhoR